MPKLTLSSTLPYPEEGRRIAERFRQALKSGAVPTRRIPAGNVVDRGLGAERFAQLINQAHDTESPADALLRCAPMGHIGEGNRFNGLNPDSSPGAWALYTGLMARTTLTSPGMVAEMRNYEAGQHPPSQLTGQPNPAHAFKHLIVARACLENAIDVVNLDINDPVVRQFNERFSPTIATELKAMGHDNVLDAIMDDKNHSAARPIGNAILQTEGIGGLLATSARHELIESGPWKGLETNLILGARPDAPHPDLKCYRVYHFEAQDNAATFKSLPSEDAEGLRALAEKSRRLSNESSKPLQARREDTSRTLVPTPPKSRKR